jgi:hypothetical protein
MSIFSQKKNEIIMCRKMFRNGEHHIKQNKPESERQILHVFSYMKSLDPNKQDIQIDMNLQGKGIWGIEEPWRRGQGIRKGDR